MRKKCLLMGLLMTMVILLLSSCQVPAPIAPDTKEIDHDVAVTLRTDYFRFLQSEYPEWISR